MSSEVNPTVINPVNQNESQIVAQKNTSTLYKIKATLISAKNTTFNALVNAAIRINSVVRNNIVDPLSKKASELNNSFQNFIGKKIGLPNFLIL